MRQLLNCHIRCPVIGRIDHDGQGICTHAEFNRGATNGFTIGCFFLFDGAAGIRDIRFTSLAEALKAGAGAYAVNGHVASIAFISETLRQCFRQRENGRTARHNDVTRHVQRVHFRQFNQFTGGFGGRSRFRRGGGCRHGRGAGHFLTRRYFRSSRCGRLGRRGSRGRSTGHHHHQQQGNNHESNATHVVYHSLLPSFVDMLIKSNQTNDEFCASRRRVSCEASQTVASVASIKAVG